MSNKEKFGMRMSLSPYGRRFCIVQYISDQVDESSTKFVIKAFDVMTGEHTILEEGIDGYQRLFLLKEWVSVYPIGFVFSPTGRYVMWAVYRFRAGGHHDIVIKVADLNQLFGNDEYEMEQAEARAGTINREAKKAGF